jgi:alpha-tubulin suppressor-like RCC1 family protein
MKKYLATAFLLAAVLSASSQSGLTCSEAIPLSAGMGNARNAVFTGSEIWFTFTSEEAAPDIVIGTGKTTKSTEVLEKMEVFSGTCNSFVKLSENKIRARNKVLPMKTSKLSKGGVYYLKITRRKSDDAVDISITQRSGGGGGGNHTAFLCANGTVKTAGSNTYGQLGNGTTGGSSSTPVSVSGLTSVTAVAAGAAHNLALLSNSTVKSWGSNVYGELGDNTTTDSNVPVSVGGSLTGITQVSAGDNFSLALKSDGTVWAWGRNANGQLGDGTNTDRTLPVQVSGLSNITDIEAGAWHAMALKSDGTVYAWGDNNYGQLGDGTTTSRNTPTLVINSFTVTAISAGDDFSVVIRSNGDVYATGDNTLGQLGNNSTTASLSYIASSSVNAVSGNMLQVSCGTEHTLALRDDLTVWAWGQNWFGQLGNGTTSSTAYLSVVQASGLSCVYEISAGWQFSTASTINGTVYTWGNNFVGQLGDGTTTNRSSPGTTGACNRLNAISISGTTTICPAGSTTLTASGGTGSYSWSPSTGLNVTTGSVVVASPTTTTTYSVTDPAGCISTPVTVTVSSPTVSVTPSSTVICSSYSATLTASGASTYSWNTGPTTSTISVSPTVTTTYTVTGTDANGCQNTATSTVTVNAPGPCCVPPTVVFTGTTTTSTSAGTLSSGAVVQIPSGYLFVIDNSPSYTNVVFRLGSNAKIEVLPLTASSTANTLTLNNCQLYSDCGFEMWNGIYLDQSGSNSANLTMNNGTRMEDAINGIVANSNTTTVSAAISISSCVFNKNYYNVQLSNYTNASTPYNLTINTTTLSCVSSTNSPGSTLLTPHSGERTYTGVRLSNVKGCTIGKTIASSDRNYFSDMDYGVYATTSGAEVVNNSFSSMAGNTVSSVPYGIGVYAPNTSSVTATVRVGGTGTYSPNTFTDLYRAVDVTYTGSVEVLGNTMTCTTTPTSFTVTGNITSQYGIRTQHINTKVEAKTNTITNFANAISVSRNTSTSTTFNPNIIVETNTVSTSGSGYVSTGIAVADALGNTITATGPVRVRDNSLSNIRDYGVLCEYIQNRPVITGTSSLSQSIGMLYASSGSIYGVYLNTCDKANVSNNSISSTNNSNTSMVGVYLYKSTNTLVSCNTISTIGIAVRAYGTSTSPYTSATSWQYGIVSNTFTSNLGGISLVSLGVIGKQGDISHPVGNVWSSTASSYTSGQLLTDGASLPDKYWYGSGTGENPSGNLASWSPTLVNAATSGSSPSCPGLSTKLVMSPAEEKPEKNISIKVYPNPSNGYLTIGADMQIDFMRIEIFDLHGKKLLTRESVKFISEQVDLSGFSAGVYYIHVTGGSGINETIQVVKE